MRDELLLEDEQFQFESESSPAANADYGRWIQRALNAVLGLQLAVDGVVGQQTRSAIRGFQQRNGLTPDGVVGPRTLAALLAGGAPPLPGTPLGLTPGSGGGPKASACASLKPKEILNNFRQDSADIKPEHDLKINQIALCIRDSQSGPSPIRRVEITGHASAEGNADYNERLGATRSQRVAERLHAALKRVLPGLESRVDLRTGTRGETDPTGRGPEADRRVEILLPLKSAPPPPPPPPPSPPPPPPPTRTRVDTVKIVIKSFIATVGSRIGAPTCDMLIFVPNPLSIPLPTTASMRLKALALAIDSSFQEDPRTDAKIDDYRLFSQAIFRVESAGGSLTSVTPSALVTDVGPECEPTHTACLQPPPITIVSPLIVRTGPTSFTFSWTVKGEPHPVANDGMSGVCPRTSVFIWHRISGLVDLSMGAPVIRIPNFEGSEFPSHRLFVNGVIRQTIPQGELRQLWIPSPADSTLVR